jgi:peptidoglycan/xylan/chitin deacetylase (PgdA/CDA1 family)
MYLIRPPSLLRRLFPGLIWTIPNEENRVFLTFDDGPDPEVTPWVLDTLAEFEAKATFFCLGKKVEKHPDLFERIKREGHAVGNHTYSHLDGWKTKNGKYFEDIERADVLIGSKLFRPPYGRIKPSQIKVLREKYKIIMWDVLSGDFDGRISSQQCLTNLSKFVKPGSIIVLHDKIRVSSKINDILPALLESLSLSERIADKIGVQY